MLKYFTIDNLKAVLSGIFIFALMFIIGESLIFCFFTYHFLYGIGILLAFIFINDGIHYLTYKNDEKVEQQK